MTGILYSFKENKEIISGKASNLLKHIFLEIKQRET